MRRGSPRRRPARAELEPLAAVLAGAGRRRGAPGAASRRRPPGGTRRWPAWTRRARGPRRGGGGRRAAGLLARSAVLGRGRRRRGAGRAGRCSGSATGSSLVRLGALLDIPAFGWAAWVALRWIGALEGWERSARRRPGGRRLGAEGRGAVRPGRRPTCRPPSRPPGLQSLGELREALGRLGDAEAVVAEWRRSPGRVGGDARDERTPAPRRHRWRRSCVALEAHLGERGRAASCATSAPSRSRSQRLRGGRPALARLRGAGGGAGRPRRRSRRASRCAALLERAAAELGWSPAAAWRAALSSQGLAGPGRPHRSSGSPASTSTTAATSRW